LSVVPRGSYEFLQPGKLTVRADGLDIMTVLGSCVAVCLFDPRRRVGGVNHYLLPHPPGEIEPASADGDRYGVLAIPRLLAAMLDAGADRRALVAAVVGGGSPVGNIKFGSVGHGNTALAREMLRQLRIQIVEESTGGDHGRHLTFSSQTGAVTVRRVNSLDTLMMEGAR
jgi:chemotaxis protein CheD